MTSARPHDSGARHAGAPRRRLVRHHLPLVMATAGAMVVLVSVPFFDVNRYPPPGDIFAEGAKGALPDAGRQHRDHRGATDDSGRGPERAPGRRPRPRHEHARRCRRRRHRSGGDHDRARRRPGERAGMRRLSTMTGYLALALIALTLLLGPLNLVLGRRLPVSSYLRRDVGIWSALTSVAHVGLASSSSTATVTSSATSWRQTTAAGS